MYLATVRLPATGTPLIFFSLLRVSIESQVRPTKRAMLGHVSQDTTKDMTNKQCHSNISDTKSLTVKLILCCLTRSRHHRPPFVSIRAWRKGARHRASSILDFFFFYSLTGETFVHELWQMRGIREIAMLEKKQHFVLFIPICQPHYNIYYEGRAVFVVGVFWISSNTTIFEIDFMVNLGHIL